ncbi:MAG TPA: ATP-binding protein [Thermoanaerobaculia bacterium]|nr:ATP-binding protein [Thermoanaerobaculia bacterium]
MTPLLRAALAAVHDPVWLVGRDRAVLESNASYRALVARGLQIPDDVYRRVLSGRTVDADALLTLDGIERVYSISGVPVVNDGESAENDVAAVFSARDVTDTTRGAREGLFELAVTRLFTPDKPLTETLLDVLEFFCESEEWDSAVIWLIENEMLVPAATWMRPDPAAQKFRERTLELRFPRGHGIPGRAWASGEIIWVPDLYEETNVLRAEVAAHAGLHCAVAMPLHDGARTAGVLELFTHAVRPINDSRKHALRAVGASLGRLIDRRRAEEERKELLAIIERKGAEWATTFDSIEMPIVIAGFDGTIARLNLAARDLAGADFRQLVGARIESISPLEPWPTLAQLVEAVADSRTGCSGESHRAEEDRSWEVSASWTDAPDGVPRAIIVLRETTMLRRLQDSVRRGEQLAALGELVAGVAHEVRNPLFGLGMTLDLLQPLVPPAPDTEELFDTLRKWVDRLNRLMENLLEYGKTWTIDLREGQLDQVIDMAIDESAAFAAANGVIIDRDIESPLPLLMDANRLARVFSNLITNAVQHSPERAHVTVRARLIPDGDREIIECTVQDQGPGFRPADLPRIFQPFFTRRRGGTGLGLSIVQRIVDEHGGTVAASNAADSGAIITVRIPAYRRPGVAGETEWNQSSVQPEAVTNESSSSTTKS